ncbi:MAG TPA: pyridoxamine 5'-phosphate oxidase family protein [Candidatus Omnitrophota bacterium]|nr:pyridoxamine 5'-phosphate oxidase family protein [Candidatus Omnitrophota bacterium]HPT07229.1 pyridoxamine 5'-phosphate oxidase family protein [Candidatus Omnitrophota bacterium]
MAHKIHQLFKSREYINVATCDAKGNPNVVPKFILKSEDRYVYLVDYVLGRTCQNLKINPRVSLSFMDLGSLTGYQFNGTVQIIDQGAGYEKLLEEVTAREISLSAKRILEGLDSGEKHTSFEIASSGKAIVFKVHIEDYAEITPFGKVKREKVE